MSNSGIENIYLCITIDTECDHDPNWTKSSPLAFRSIIEGIPKILQPIFEDVGAVPTYLLTVEVLEDNSSVKTLSELKGQFEYGTHLHSAFIEPEKKFYNYAGVDSPDFQCNYPKQIEYEKIKNLTNLFQCKLGYTPTSFRAGRFGAGANTIQALKKLGYKVDTSVTPYIRWTEPMGAVDFRLAPSQPYWPSDHDLCKSALLYDSSDVLEVPVTIKNRRFRTQPHWFRPWFSDVTKMKQIFHHHVKKNATSKNVVLNMMFHSMEVIEKASPYPQNFDDVKRYLNDTHEILRWCSKEGVQFVGLSELHSKLN